MKIITGIPAHKHFFFLEKRKPVLKEKMEGKTQSCSFGKAFLLKKRFVVNAAEQGLRIKEVGISIWGDGRISGGFD